MCVLLVGFLFISLTLNAVRQAITDPIIIGTPGKVMELLGKRILTSRSIKILVLDEADVMVDTQGIGEQSIRIKGYAFSVLITSTNHQQVH